MTDERLERLEMQVSELKVLVRRGYNIAAGAFDAIQEITEVKEAEQEDIQIGVAAVLDHARKLMGLKRGESPFPLQQIGDQFQAGIKEIT